MLINAVAAATAALQPARGIADTIFDNSCAGVLQQDTLVPALLAPNRTVSPDGSEFTPGAAYFGDENTTDGLIVLGAYAAFGATAAVILGGRRGLSSPEL